MTSYDVLAPHYDAVTGDADAEVALIRDIVERQHPRASTLLDVACGTGAVTVPLSRAYQVSGLDISPGMLAVARGKLPDGTALYQADMTSFRLRRRFDVIVCAYQGVNHLLSLPDWRRFFGCAYRHLNPGGLLVFDIATLGYLEAMASGPKIIEPFEDNYLQITVSTAGDDVFRWQIEVFERQPDGQYSLITQDVRLRSFPVDEVTAVLGRRFSGVDVIGGDGRLWLTCTRPG